VKAEFAFGVTTAHKFTRIAETFGANFQTSENLAFEAWAMLAAPSTQPAGASCTSCRRASGLRLQRLFGQKSVTGGVRINTRKRVWTIVQTLLLAAMPLPNLASRLASSMNEPKPVMT